MSVTTDEAQMTVGQFLLAAVIATGTLLYLMGVFFPNPALPLAGRTLAVIAVFAWFVYAFRHHNRGVMTAAIALSIPAGVFLLGADQLLLGNWTGAGLLQRAFWGVSPDAPGWFADPHIVTGLLVTVVATTFALALWKGGKLWAVFIVALLAVGARTCDVNISASADDATKPVVHSYRPNTATMTSDGVYLVYNGRERRPDYSAGSAAFTVPPGRSVGFRYITGTIKTFRETGSGPVVSMRCLLRLCNAVAEPYKHLSYPYPIRERIGADRLVMLFVNNDGAILRRAPLNKYDELWWQNTTDEVAYPTVDINQPQKLLRDNGLEQSAVMVRAQLGG